MKYTGKVKDGVVVLDEPATLPDGATVTIELADAPSKTAPGENLMKYAGKATGLPVDASRNLDHYLYGHPKQ